jgi:hypothetical protein
VVSGELFPHHPIHTDLTRAYQQNREEGRQVEQGGLVLGKGLTFMKKERSYRHIDDEHQGRNPGEQTQYQQERAKYFCKYDQNQGPAMANMEWIEKDILLVAEMHELGKSMIHADQQAKGQSKKEGSKIKAVPGVIGR